MATSSPNYEPSPKQEASATKRLSDLLREEQEPFVLEVYLLERRPRYHPQQKSSVSEGRFGCNFLSTEKKCPVGGFSKLDRRRASVSASFKCSRITKAILNKVVSVNETVLLKSYVAAGLEIKDENKMQTNIVNKGEQEILDETEGSTMSSTDNSCSTEVQTRSGSVEIEEVEVTSSSKEQLNHLLAANKEHLLQWRAVEENKDCSPVSVLDPVEPVSVNNNGIQFNSKQNYHKFFKSKQRQEVTTTTMSSPSSNMTFPKKVVTEECLLSASLWELLLHSRRESSSSICDPGPSNPPAYSQYSINFKRAMQQSRQLMFDCVREAVEMTRAKKKQRKDDDVEEKGLLMQPEEIEKFICNNMMNKSSRGSMESGKKLTHLIRSELVGSFDEWRVYDLTWKKIGIEVGDRILEEIKDELVQEMVDSFHCNDVG